MGHLTQSTLTTSPKPTRCSLSPAAAWQPEQANPHHFSLRGSSSNAADAFLSFASVPSAPQPYTLLQANRRSCSLALAGRRTRPPPHSVRRPRRRVRGAIRRLAPPQGYPSSSPLHLSSSLLSCDTKHHRPKQRSCSFQVPGIPACPWASTTRMGAGEAHWASREAFSIPTHLKVLAPP